MKRTIGQLAKELDINIETIRFYERKGLIQQPLKPIQGYRTYSDNVLNRLRFIKNTKEIGFTLKEILALLKINDAPCSQVQELAEHKVNAVKQKINDLQSLESALHKLLNQCQTNKDEKNCPIIDSLQNN